MEQHSNNNDLCYKGSALQILDLGKLNGVTENPLSFTESSVDLESFSQKFNSVNDDLLCDKCSHLDLHALEVDSEIGKQHLSGTGELVESDWLDFQEADVQYKAGVCYLLKYACIFDSSISNLLDITMLAEMGFNYYCS